MNRTHHQHGERFVDYLILVVILSAITYLIFSRRDWINNITTYAGDVFTWLIIGAGTLSFLFIMWLVWRSRGDEQETERPDNVYTTKLRR